MRRRTPKKNDQQNVQHAYELLEELAKQHPKIEANIWVSAMVSAIIHSYSKSGFTPEDFSKELDTIKSYFKHVFQEN